MYYIHIYINIYLYIHDIYVKRYYFYSTILPFTRRIPDGKSPRFPKKPTIRQEEDILIMECILEAHPIPDIIWYCSDKQISDSHRTKMTRKAITKDSYILTLEIQNPTKDDGGNYRCNAINMYGESNANIALNFQGITNPFLQVLP